MIFWYDIDLESDCEKAIIAWRSFGSRRPHDHPAFLKVMRLPDQNPVLIHFVHDSGAAIIYSFYLLQLNKTQRFGDFGVPASHVSSPYGYGGPIYDGPQELKEHVSQEFEAELSMLMLEKRVVSEFVREDIFQDRLVARTVGERAEQQPNIVVDLDVDMEERWERYRHKVRKNVNKAQNLGLHVIFDREGLHLSDFVRIYHGTMRRNNAADSFFIGLEKFKYLADALKKERGSLYVHVCDGSDVVSTELLLLSSDAIYSFLGGTIATHFDKRPNDLLKHEVIKWGKAHSFKYYVLGGGAAPEDGIYRYKRSFEPDGIYPFYIRKIVHNKSIYEELLKYRDKYERAKGGNWVPRENFFPLYLS